VKQVLNRLMHGAWATAGTAPLPQTLPQFGFDLVADAEMIVRVPRETEAWSLTVVSGEHSVQLLLADHAELSHWMACHSLDGIWLEFP